MKKKKIIKEDGAPTNSMGNSSASSGPIQTYDPMLLAGMQKRKMLQRFSTFLKGKQFKK